jgi:hypothetical protein
MITSLKPRLREYFKARLKTFETKPVGPLRVGTIQAGLTALDEKDSYAILRVAGALAVEFTAPGATEAERLAAGELREALDEEIDRNDACAEDMPQGYRIT